MKYSKISIDNINELKLLQIKYKLEINENSPTDENIKSLFQAISSNQIYFFGCFDEERLIACCSITPTYSTFDYRQSGVFEDFYILPEYRHRGIARKLIQFAKKGSGINNLTVGCADCDVEMYKSLGFTILIGNMYAMKE